MEQRPAVRRNRPPQEPGPRLLPIALALAVVGFAAGAGGKLLMAHLPHPAKATAPHATPSPNFALLGMHGQVTRLAPIPTPEGTWYLSVPASPAASPLGLRTAVAASASPTVLPSAVPTPAASITAKPTAKPTTAPAPVSTPSPEPTKQPNVARVKVRHAVKHSVAIRAIATPAAAPTASVTLSVPPPVATPQRSASERTVYRYLSSLIRGDEATAYSLLGAAPGDKSAHLSEESFINTSARISSVSTGEHASANTVHAEIETAGGSYYATYHTAEQDGRLIIIDHDFIKL